MREIKYRAYDKIDKKIKNVVSIEWLNQEFNEEPFIVGFEEYYKAIIPGEPGEIDKDMLWRNASQVELMQYTGLNDKNGNEIYEGYIVLAPNRDTCIVKYDDRYARWLLIGNDRYNDNQYDFYYYDDNIYSISELKVIGNIYQNPELLGVNNGNPV